jgi:hypothetical protein
MKLTLEQETLILFYIENYQGKGPKDMDRNILYEIFNLYRPQEGRGPHVCTCMDRDTVNKVNVMIGAYTFSDEIRFTPRFHQLLPQLALIQEEEPLEEISNVEMKFDISKLEKSMDATIQEEVAKPVPVKAVRKKRTTKKK